jgi:hypothetical protein
VNEGVIARAIRRSATVLQGSCRSLRRSVAARLLPGQAKPDLRDHNLIRPPASRELPEPRARRAAVAPCRSCPLSTTPALWCRCATDPVRTEVPVPSGRGRLRRSGPPRLGTDRRAGHGKASVNLTRNCHLGSGEGYDLRDAMLLSVGSTRDWRDLREWHTGGMASYADDSSHWTVERKPLPWTGPP